MEMLNEMFKGTHWERYCREMEVKTRYKRIVTVYNFWKEHSDKKRATGFAAACLGF